ncbi:Lrp/AsnC family transcriptional regulator [Leeia sp. TBRC 13508]|uniref:Lrp/AsnC family transcriptional regulator n=1 Tax=Leeia speluncae TaxID=2884804 RepID=A0ABS8D3B3_9NEIS|nr:Lrp/AsnC family transcriptional regulator [Leeia speluncae]MCB6182678.1 Lrp/AsnC family transcriptional regulator [Leeia speluncae]
MLLDRFDHLILQALQKDARVTHQKLAQTIPLSSSQIGRRIQQLEEIGVIHAYRAELRPESMGLGVLAFIDVCLERHGEKAIRDFLIGIEAIPEILEAHAITGDADYALRVVAADLTSLSRFVMHKLLAMDCVRSVRSSIALEQVKQFSGLPSPHHFS